MPRPNPALIAEPVARRRPSTVHGIAVVDKPPGVTSHDVVAVLRRRFAQRRVGHAGTLDPDATGVLVVGVGNATRLLRFVTESPKRYTGEVVLGVQTSTLDASGDVVATHDMGGVTLTAARQAATALTGEIVQVPPMVSALKQGGVRLHQLARRGVEVERAPRPVTVFGFDVEPCDEPGVLRIAVACSSGTYVRSLAAELGRLLGGGAHLRNLRRTAVGRFDVSAAAPPDECELLPVAAAVETLDAVVVDAGTAAKVVNGRVLRRWGGDGPWAIFDVGGELLAVYEGFGDDDAKPSVVLPTPAAR